MPEKELPYWMDLEEILRTPNPEKLLAQLKLRDYFQRKVSPQTLLERENVYLDSGGKANTDRNVQFVVPLDRVYPMLYNAETKVHAGAAATESVSIGPPPTGEAWLVDWISVYHDSGAAASVQMQLFLTENNESVQLLYAIVVDQSNYFQIYPNVENNTTGQMEPVGTGPIQLDNQCYIQVTSPTLDATERMVVKWAYRKVV